MVNFSKYHSLGNNFIFINCLDNSLYDSVKGKVEFLCDPQRGIGADGVIVVLKSDLADFKMVVINADGSIPEMCGNGLRCFTRFVSDQGLTGEDAFTVETGRGVLAVSILERFNKIKVDMGPPILNRHEIPMMGDSNDIVINDIVEPKYSHLTFTAVSMGNPHIIHFCSDLADINLEELGPFFESHPKFPNRTNVEFASVKNLNEVEMMVWERGVGRTGACGTGACAVVVAGVLNDVLDRRATVHLPGGDLDIEWADNNHIFMTGDAEFVFSGSVEI